MYEHLQYRAHVNAKDSGGDKTALMVAAAKGYTGVLRVLLFHGAAVHAADKNGNFAIHLATIYGHLECVKLLMNWGGLGNVGNLKFLTPLMLAAKYGHFRIFKYLLGKGVNISYQLNRFKESELTLAVRKGCSRIVQLLLKIANPKIDRTAELNRALSIAISLDRLKTTKVLIAFGADVNSIEEDGKPSIYAAILRNNLDLTNCLVSNGADINQKNRFGLTPLMFAIKMEQVNIVRYLIKAGADIHAVEERTGQTALEMAKNGKNKDIMKVFEKEI